VCTGVPMRRGIESAFAEWRFLSLTLLICAYLLAAPLIVGKWQVQMLMEVLLLLTVLVTVSANPGWRNMRRALVVLWLMSVTGTLLSVFSERPDLSQWYRTVELLTSVPVLAVLAAGMLAFVRRERRLTLDSIFATVAAYLLLALLFAQIYLCLMTWNPASFSLPVDAAERPVHLLQSDMTYFSLVTLATVGYGDILPATHVARMLAMFQAMIGVFYLAVVVAMFVGAYASQPRE
jgi:voltage-gated potassium channel